MKKWIVLALCFLAAFLVHADSEADKVNKVDKVNRSKAAKNAHSSKGSKDSRSSKKSKDSKSLKESKSSKNEKALAAAEQSIFLTNSSPNQLCPVFSDGIYVLLQPTSLQDAASACLQFGLGLANLTFSNNFVAGTVLGQCGATVGWLSAFEGVVSSTCVVLTSDGNIFFPDAGGCSQAAQNVPVCQAFANTIVSTTTTTLSFCTPVTITQTSSSLAVVTTTQTDTVTSTASQRRHEGPCRRPHCVRTRTATFTPPPTTLIVTITSGVTTATLKDALDRPIPTVKDAYELQVRVQPAKPVVVVYNAVDQESTCPKHLPLCYNNDNHDNDHDSANKNSNSNSGAIGEFAVINSIMPFSQAECACRQLGMQVARLCDLSLPSATKAVQRCGQGFSAAWIRSYNSKASFRSNDDKYDDNDNDNNHNDNDNGDLCLAVDGDGAVAYPGSCQAGLKVLCQRRATQWTSKTFPNQFNELQTAPNYTLCDVTQNGLFIVTTPQGQTNGNYGAACASFGLQPANVFSQTRGAAAVVFDLCSQGDSAAVAAIAQSFEAIEGSVCDLVDNNGAVLVVDSVNGAVAQNCQQNRYFLCQATNAPQPPVSTIFTGPYVLVSTTTAVTTSLTTIPTTVTVSTRATSTTTTTEVELISLTITTLVSVTTTTVSLTQGQTVTVTTTDVSTVTPVPPTQCPAILLKRAPEHKGFVVLQDRAPYWEAECACRAYNLRLATLTVDTFLDAAEAVQRAVGSAQKAWIRKYNQPGQEPFGKQCLALYTRSDNYAHDQSGKYDSTNGGGAVLPMYCDVPSPIVCQVQ